MVAGRKVIEQATRMGVADLSVLISALQVQSEDARLITVRGSDNDFFWSLMVEKGWLINLGNPHPAAPIMMASYGIVDEHRPHIHAVAIVCFDGLKQGMTPEEIIAFAEGNADRRLAHLL